jgi:Protein of unknown function (DUF3365)
MRRRTLVLAGATMIAVLTSSSVLAQRVAPPANVQPAPGPLLARAQTAARTLSTELLARLLKELEAGGPARAIAVCSDEAPAITARLSKDGLKIRRVTTRPRNPLAAPDAFEAEKLTALAAAHNSGAAVADIVVVTGTRPRRTLRLLRPIVVANACLACHGDASALDPAVKKSLATRYPHDQAVGYQEGDLCGAISVTVDELEMLR